MQWFVEMLPGMQEQHQMIAPVFRWALDAEETEGDAERRLRRA